MRCLIKQNELNGTCNPTYREELLIEGKKWNNAESLTNPWEVELGDLQRAVDKELNQQVSSFQPEPPPWDWWWTLGKYGIGTLFAISIISYLWTKVKE